MTQINSMNDLEAFKMAARDAVSITPVGITEYNPPEGADSSVTAIEAELRVHGELEVEVEERGEVEFHRGNTEFDYGAGVVRVDTRKELLTIPMDRLCVGERHYEAQLGN
jgi:hypothetical protein